MTTVVFEEKIENEQIKKESILLMNKHYIHIITEQRKEHTTDVMFGGLKIYIRNVLLEKFKYEYIFQVLARHVCLEHVLFKLYFFDEINEWVILCNIISYFNLILKIKIEINENDENNHFFITSNGERVVQGLFSDK